MRLESVSLIALVAIGSGIAYAWWASRGRRRPDSLERDAVAGHATVTGLTHEAGGAVRVAYRFRHPFSGSTYDGSGTLPAGTAVPALGTVVDIAYLPDDPQRSRLAIEPARD
jgi:hypothetical protein